MILIAGLGNPGEQYALTRHNVGWMLVECVARRIGADFADSPYQGRVARAKVRGTDVMLVKPMTFMNLSGECVAPCARAHGVPVSSILSITDEIQFPVGRIRMDEGGGGDGGHNGLAALIHSLGDAGFRRLRIGVGAEQRSNLKDFVLSGFGDDEKDLLNTTLTYGTDAVVSWLEGGGDHAAYTRVMGRFNARTAQPRAVWEQSRLAHDA